MVRLGNKTTDTNVILFNNKYTEISIIFTKSQLQLRIQLKKYPDSIFRKISRLIMNKEILIPKLPNLLKNGVGMVVFLIEVDFSSLFHKNLSVMRSIPFYGTSVTVHFTC